MLTKLFANTLYVQVRKNRFRLRHIEGKQEREVSAQTPFTTTRLLVGQYQAAETLLKQAMRAIGSGGLFRVSPVVVIQPMELVEGGLSEVEERVYRELARGAGARQVFVHIGAPLSDAEVLTMSQNKQRSR